MFPAALFMSQAFNAMTCSYSKGLHLDVQVPCGWEQHVDLKPSTPRDEKNCHHKSFSRCSLLRGVKKHQRPTCNFRSTWCSYSMYPSMHIPAKSKVFILEIFWHKQLLRPFAIRTRELSKINVNDVELAIDTSQA